MNLKNKFRTGDIHLIPTSAAPPYESDRMRFITERPTPIEDIQSASEETMIRLRSNPGYGLHRVIADTKCRALDEGLICELDLVVGRLVVCVSDSKSKLKRLLRRFANKSRVITQGILVKLGDELAEFRTEFANCIRVAQHVFIQKPDQEAERRRRKVRERRGWAPCRNIQPQFA